MHLNFWFSPLFMRVLMCFVSSSLISYFFIRWFIKMPYFRAKARALTPERHISKNNVPTMGGLCILMSIGLNMFFWCDTQNAEYIWVCMGCMIGFGILGAWDDWLKIHRHAGISAHTKWIGQLLISIIVVGFLLYITQWNTHIKIPFFETWQLDSGIWFMPWALLVLIATSNAVNLTDGLDGLAVGSLIPIFSTFALLICYANIFYSVAPKEMELVVFIAIIVGSLCAFLLYNKYPARIFMGDVGSLSLGAGLACIALLTKQELLLPILGCIFVLETVSVILQIVTFKLYKKRLFKMAPIHHHFELMGWREPTIVFYFSCVTLLICSFIIIYINK